MSHTLFDGSRRKGVLHRDLCDLPALPFLCDLSDYLLASCWNAYLDISGESLCLTSRQAMSATASASGYFEVQCNAGLRKEPHVPCTNRSTANRSEGLPSRRRILVVAYPEQVRYLKGLALVQGPNNEVKVDVHQVSVESLVGLTNENKVEKPDRQFVPGQRMGAFLMYAKSDASKLEAGRTAWSWLFHDRRQCGIMLCKASECPSLNVSLYRDSVCMKVKKRGTRYLS